MSSISDDIADRDDVIKRAIEILKREDGIELSKELMNELYDITYKYIKERIKNDDIQAVYFKGLGAAYYNINYIAKQRLKTKYSKVPSQKEKSEKWCRFYNQIKDYYQNNQTGVNTKKSHVYLPIIQPLEVKLSRMGYTEEDVEEIQNNIGC